MIDEFSIFMLIHSLPEGLEILLPGNPIVLLSRMH